MNNVNDYLSKDTNTTLTTLDQAIVNDFINMNIGYEFYTESVNPLIIKLNESKSIMNIVNAQLDKYNEDKLNVLNDRIIKYFIDTNINSIKSLNLHIKRQKKLSDKMKLQSREIHRLLMKEFSNKPEPRFLPRIDFVEGKKLFKDGFNNFKDNIKFPNYFKSNEGNKTNDNWRTGNNYSLKAEIIPNSNN